MFSRNCFADRAESSRPRCRAAFSFSAWRSPPRRPSRPAEAEAEAAAAEGAEARAAAQAAEARAQAAGGAGGAEAGEPAQAAERRRRGERERGGAAERERAAAEAAASLSRRIGDTGRPHDLRSRPGLGPEATSCLQRRSDVLPDSELTEYAYALAKADRFQEAIDVLDMLDNPNTPRALNYRGYATRKLGRIDEGIGYYLKSVALDPAYPQVREYLGEAYVIEGKFDLAKDQLATIEKICGAADCEYYGELAKALDDAHAL